MEALLKPVEIDQIPVGRFAIFSYLITDPETREAVIIDPGAEPGKVLERVRKRDAQVRWLLCTHIHPDHIGGTAALKDALTGVQVAVHEVEAPRMRRWSRTLLVRLMGGKTVRRVDRSLKDGDRLSLGRHVLEVLHTPGHSPGSICLYTRGHLFTGDTLFVGGVGRTDLPGASTGEMAASLRGKILSLPMETRIWPGHDYGSTPSNLLGDERRDNPFVHALEHESGGKDTEEWT